MEAIEKGVDLEGVVDGFFDDLFEEEKEKTLTPEPPTPTYTTGDCAGPGPWDSDWTSTTPSEDSTSDSE